MSADRFSVGEFSEFLDDSEGHRLAQFLQKKTGTVRPARPIFNGEPERFSLNVQVKRVSTPGNTQGRQEGEHNRRAAECTDELKSSPLKLRVDVEENDVVAAPEGEEHQNDRTLTAEHSPAVNESSIKVEEENEEEIVAVGELGTPVEAPNIVRPPLVHSLPMVLLPERPLSPARRSGGVGTADRLRRYSLKRLSQLGVGGRRMLLKEFESTLSTPNFAPLVCSTPMSRPQLTSPVVSEPQRTDSVGGNVAHTMGVTFTNADANKSSGLSPLRHKDKELREMLENVLEKTIQKLHEKENNIGNALVDVVDCLNPTNPQHIREVPCTPRSRHSSVHQMDVNTELHECCRNAASPQLRANTEVQGTQELLQEAQKLLKSLSSPKLQVSKIVIPVQQTLNGVPPTEASGQVLAHDTTEERRKEDDAANPAEQKLVQQKGGKQTPPSPPRSEKPASPRRHCEKSHVNKTLSKSKTSTDNVTIGKNSRMEHKSPLPPSSARILRHDPPLAEIMTEDDDEDADETSLTIASCSGKSGPLNLAAARPISVTPLRPSRRLRRLAGSRRRRHSLDRSQLTTTETKVGPPPAHPFNLRGPQTANPKEATRKRPLNKAPNVPINGEEFADELKAHLARLTNYEILDLRKRNSLREVFPMSGRRRSVAAKQQAIERQLELEEQIQMEILRRNLEGNGDGLECAEDQQQVQPHDEEMAIGDENIFQELPPVPDNFRDSRVSASNNLQVDTMTSPRIESILVQIAAGAECNSSLVDERSCDRISFVQPSSQSFKSSRRSKCKNKMPEVVEKYLDVRRKVVKHRPLNKSKRSLYTRGHSESEPEEGGNFSTIPVPPATSPIASPRVLSPPPSISNAPPTPTRHSRSSNSNSKSCEEILLPPVSFMDAATGSTPVTIESDEAIFKKPLLPAPKVRGSSKSEKKRIKTTVASNQMDASEVPSLRRSKRGHVPVNNTLLQFMFQRLEQQQARKLKKPPNKHLVVASSTANSHSGAASHSRRRGRKPYQGQSSTVSDLNLSGDTDASCQTTASVSDGPVPAAFRHQRRELSAIFEPLTESEVDDVVDVPTVLPAADKVTSTTSKKTASKQPKKRAPVVRRKVPATTKASNSTNRLEHNHIQVPPAPVNELNNIFDQLKHAAVQSRAASPMAPSSCTDGTRRTKEVRVRLKRLNLASCSTPVSDTTNNENDREPRAANTCSPPSSPSISEPVSTDKARDRVSLAATRAASNSTVDLLSWLKGVCQIQMPSGHEQMFMDMRCSAAGNLMFTVLEGIDYAFYDTEDRASLGYLRFRPRQKKPAKKAKKYHLHFIVLAGEFDIGTDREHGTFNTGDMVAINIGCRYTIENIRDDVGLLMVIKK